MTTIERASVRLDGRRLRHDEVSPRLQGTRLADLTHGHGDERRYERSKSDTGQVRADPTRVDHMRLWSVRSRSAVEGDGE